MVDDTRCLGDGGQGEQGKHPVCEVDEPFTAAIKLVDQTVDGGNHKVDNDDETVNEEGKVETVTLQIELMYMKDLYIRNVLG